MAKGIDYGHGTTNIDRKTGIRFGVLPQNAVLQSWCDSSEPVYPDPEPSKECESCGGTGEVSADLEEERLVGPIACTKEECEECGGTGEVEGEDCGDCEPLGFVYRDEGIFAHCGECGDIFVEDSPFYTRAAFCSPCAPGACYLLSPTNEGELAYCLPADWFDDDSPCPYPVYSVKDHSLLFVPEGWYTCEDGEGNKIALPNPK